MTYDARPVTPNFIQANTKSTAVFRINNNTNKLFDLDGNSASMAVARDAKRKIDVVDLSYSAGMEKSTTSTKRMKSTNMDHSNKTTTTTNDARYKLKAKRERAAQHEKMTAESISWRQKYKKAFPSFVFYFDAVDSSTELNLVKAVERLGAVSIA